MEKLTDGELRLMEVLWDLAPINSTSWCVPARSG
mgnify:CR=1 FL=1